MTQALPKKQKKNLMLTSFIIRNLETIAIYTERSFQEKNLQKYDENSYSNFDIHTFSMSNTSIRKARLKLAKN